jgi:hypothetical protein
MPEIITLKGNIEEHIKEEKRCEIEGFKKLKDALIKIQPT